MEARAPVIAKRLWHIVRVVFFMLRKGICKGKLLMDLQLLMKRGKLAGKALSNLMFHHNSSYSFHSHDPHPAFSAPREYEFSCSNSPVVPVHLAERSKNHHLNYNHSHYFPCVHPTASTDNVAASALQKTLEMLHSAYSSASASPAPASWLAGSPAVRQLRITDSPFPVTNNDEEYSYVDKEAEAFIQKFYEQLRFQNSMAASEDTYAEDIA